MGSSTTQIYYNIHFRTRWVVDNPRSVATAPRHYWGSGRSKTMESIIIAHVQLVFPAFFPACAILLGYVRLLNFDVLQRVCDY